MRTARPKLGVFSKLSKYHFFVALITQLVKKATATVFKSGDRGYSPVRFEYNTASERYLVAELWLKQFWVFFEKSEILNFFENTQNCFAYISATKHGSEAVLYSKRTQGSPLSPYLKTIAVVFFTSWVIKQRKCCTLKVLKKHPLRECGAHLRWHLKKETLFFWSFHIMINKNM